MAGDDEDKQEGEHEDEGEAAGDDDDQEVCHETPGGLGGRLGRLAKRMQRLHRDDVRAVMAQNSVWSAGWQAANEINEAVVARIVALRSGKFPESAKQRALVELFRGLREQGLRRARADNELLFPPLSSSAVSDEPALTLEAASAALELEPGEARAARRAAAVRAAAAQQEAQGVGLLKLFSVEPVQEAALAAAVGLDNEPALSAWRRAQRDFFKSLSQLQRLRHQLATGTVTPTVPMATLKSALELCEHLFEAQVEQRQALAGALAGHGRLSEAVETLRGAAGLSSARRIWGDCACACAAPRAATSTRPFGE